MAEESKQRVSYDVFVSEFHETMRTSFNSYLVGMEACTHPVELLEQHEEFVLFTSMIYAELTEVISSAIEGDPSDYH